METENHTHEDEIGGQNFTDMETENHTHEDEIDGLYSDEVSNDEKHMTETIAKAPIQIRSILSIFKASYIHDIKGEDSRQLDYSVNEFMKQFPTVDSSNFYQLKMDEKIKDARCFFMILKQLNPCTSRRVSML
jgi:hypothetical protein